MTTNTNSNSIFGIKDYFARHNGIQRSNRFTVSFGGLPGPVAAYEDSEKVYPLSFVSIGGRAIEGVADNLSGYGMGRIQPRSQKFPTLVLLAFAVTNDSHILKMFNAWFNYLHSGSRIAQAGNSPTGNKALNTTNKFTVEYYDTAVYPVSMSIKLLNPNGDVNQTFTFYEIMPVETQPIEFDMTKSNQQLMYQVSINYREFVQYSPKSTK